MKKIFYIINFAIIIAFLSSCEEVVDIDLNTSNPKVIIESGIYKDSVCTARISYTNSYFATEDEVLVNNAIVSITDSDGNTENLTNIGEGIYIGSSIIGIPGKTYTINVDVDGEIFTASSRMGLDISDLSLDYSLFSFQGFTPDSLYNVGTKFFDVDLETEDYYLVKIYVNGEDIDPSSYTVISDNPSSADTIIFDPFYIIYEAYDTVDVEIISIDKPIYQYYYDLSNALSQGMGGSATPYNPISNFGHNKLGYFATYNPMKAQIITLP